MNWLVEGPLGFLVLRSSLQHISQTCVLRDEHKLICMNTCGFTVLHVLLFIRISNRIVQSNSLLSLYLQYIAALTTAQPQSLHFFLIFSCHCCALIHVHIDWSFYDVLFIQLEYSYYEQKDETVLVLLKNPVMQFLVNGVKPSGLTLSTKNKRL